MLIADPIARPRFSDDITYVTSYDSFDSLHEENTFA